MSSEPRTCPDCGARNPTTAQWCSQCLRSLEEDPASPATAPDEPAASSGAPADQVETRSSGLPSVFAGPPAPARPSRPQEAPREPASDSSVEPLATGGGRFRRVDGEVEWSCRVCDAWNVIGRLSCSTCGASMEAPSDGGDAEVDPDRVLRASILLPGGGQWVLGQQGRAVARVVLGLLWLLGGIVLLVSGAGSGAPSLLPGLVLVGGSAVLWVLSAADARTMAAGGGRELLGDRVFLWLVVGVLGGSIASLLVAALSAAGG